MGPKTRFSKLKMNDVRFRFIHLQMFKKFFQGWTCDAGGAEMCMTTKNKQCVQIAGNIRCEGCFPGFQATSGTSDAPCEGFVVFLNNTNVFIYNFTTDGFEVLAKEHGVSEESLHKV